MSCAGVCGLSALESRWVPAQTCKASGLSVMTSIEVRGNEEEEFDQEVQSMARRGYRIVDKSLVVDPAASPPVWGWILWGDDQC